MALERGFSRRQVVTGALGVGAATAVGVTIARAQTSTPTAGTSGSSTSTEQEEYSDFVAKLAANLGNLDATKVDTAIRTTLKQMVDEQLTAGNISANEATSLKSQIDSSTFPAGLRLFDLDGGGPGGQGEHGQHGNDNENRQNKGTTPSNATPVATPATT